MLINATLSYFTNNINVVFEETDTNESIRRRFSEYSSLYFFSPASKMNLRGFYEIRKSSKSVSILTAQMQRNM